MININPDKKTGISGFFSSSQKTPCDYFRGEIVNLSDVEFKKDFNHTIKKNAKSISKLEGEWTNYLKIDGKTYWISSDYDLSPFIIHDFTLPSDSSHREDLKELINDNADKSQKIKEEYEEVQRKDRELRKNYLKINCKVSSHY